MMEFKWYNEKNDFDGHPQTPMTIKRFVQILFYLFHDQNENTMGNAQNVLIWNLFKAIFSISG